MESRRQNDKGGTHHGRAFWLLAICLAGTEVAAVTRALGEVYFKSRGNLVVCGCAQPTPKCIQCFSASTRPLLLHPLGSTPRVSVNKSPKNKMRSTTLAGSHTWRSGLQMPRCSLRGVESLSCWTHKKPDRFLQNSSLNIFTLRLINCLAQLDVWMMV